MKLLKVIVPALLASAIALTGNAQTPNDNGLGLDPRVEKITVIPVSLPRRAQVRLKNGYYRSGQVIGIDPGRQQLTLSSSPDSIPFAQIRDVTLTGELWWPTPNGINEISGDELPAVTTPKASAVGVPKVLKVRLNGFQWEDPKYGTARIPQGSVVDVDEKGTGDELQRILKVVQDLNSRYVVNEMRFDNAGIITLTATAKSRYDLASPNRRQSTTP